jgi:MFS transporter, PHS family, inorganic phosphate transporter
MVAGSGIFTDAYDIFSINLGMSLHVNDPADEIVSTLLGYVYFRDATHQGILPSALDEALKLGTSVGAIMGQLVFGVLCDRLGRKRVFPNHSKSNGRCMVYRS